MPTYEYLCKKCRHPFTTMMSMQDHDQLMTMAVREAGGRAIRCPHCKSSDVIQQLDFAYAKTSKKSI